MASLITLTSDFGTRDGFVAQMKGVILGINSEVKLVDVAHDIEPFSILEGALVVKGLATYYPPGSIHVAVVDPGVGGQRRAIAIEADGQYFVGPDNGIFSLVLGHLGNWKIREVKSSEYTLPDPHPTFHGRDIFAPCAACLSIGKSFDSVGPVVTDPVVLPIPNATGAEDGIIGEVMHVDRYGSLMSNIEARMLVHPVKSVFAGKAEIDGVKFFFGEVEQGMPLALVNSFGYLEIAVNRGNASETLGMGKGDRIEVRWAWKE